MRTLTLLTFLSLGLLFITACEKIGIDKWTAYLYPNGDITAVIKEGPFNTKDQCLDWAHAHMNSDRDDYACGRSCRPGSSGILDTCQETVSRQR